MIARAVNADSDGLYLVGYIEDVRGPTLLRRLRAAFGEDFEPGFGALPFEAGPFNRREAAELDELLQGTAGALGPFGDRLFWQPPASEVEALTTLRALELARETLGPPGFPAPDDLTELERREYEFANQFRVMKGYQFTRCVAVFDFCGPNMPPGKAALVDHAGGQVIERGYFYLATELERRGYKTPGLTEEQERQYMEIGHNWLDYEPGEPTICTQCGNSAVVGVPCCGAMPVAGEWEPKES